MRQSSIAFRSNALTLEGVLSVPGELSPPFPGVLVCHPHPLFGGNMDNPVIVAICRALDQKGMASLRFNFRGVGDSEGSFSNGPQEREDLKASLHVFKRWPGINGGRLGIAGYSFGASVILGGLVKYKAARALALVSSPISAVQRSAIAKDKRHKLFLVGDKDHIVSPSRLEEALKDVKEPVEYYVLPGADHSLRGQESAVASHVADFFARTLR